jgi:PEGA domain
MLPSGDDGNPLSAQFGTRKSPSSKDIAARLPMAASGIPIARLQVPRLPVLGTLPVRAHKHITWSAALLAGVICLSRPVRADAQIHGGAVVHVRPVSTHVVLAGGYYGGFYDPFWFYGPWYGYYGPWGYPPPFPYFPYSYYYDPGASLRLEVKPQEAEVYVDGYYAGIVDDFDGVFQRLPVTPGEHEIELYRDGYRSVRQKVYATPRNTFKLKYMMERLAGGEQQEPRPEPVNQPTAGAQPPQTMPPAATGRPGGRHGPPLPPQAPGAPRGAETAAYGTLSIRVQPGDAEVSIDGEKWRGPETQDRLIVEVAEGRHTIEIQKAGYRTYVTDVQVRSGETTTLNVSLRTQNEQ